MQQFLWEQLRLELSPEKTLVTHATDGFDFLGFHIRRYTRPRDGTKPVTLVTPSTKSIMRLKDKIRHMTRHNLRRDDPYLKFVAVNQLLRGWIGYYQHVNAKDVADHLDWWVERRMVDWLADHHCCGIRQVLKQYQHDDLGRKNLAVKDEDGRPIFLYLMCRHPITRYIDHKRANPYLDAELNYLLSTAEAPDLDRDRIWNGSEYAWGWREARAARLTYDNNCCTRCGATEHLEVHHRHRRWWNQRQQGNDDLDELQTLCATCHDELHRQMSAG